MTWPRSDPITAFAFLGSMRAALTAPSLAIEAWSIHASNRAMSWVCKRPSSSTKLREDQIWSVSAAQAPDFAGTSSARGSDHDFGNRPSAENRTANSSFAIRHSEFSAYDRLEIAAASGLTRFGTTVASASSSAISNSLPMASTSDAGLSTPQYLRVVR